MSDAIQVASSGRCDIPVSSPDDHWCCSESTPLLQDSVSLGSHRNTSSNMEKLKNYSVSKTLDKLAVPAAPGLTTAQLMLANEDLQPVEPARRVWTHKNFIFFWISDSFNISMSFEALLTRISP